MSFHAQQRLQLTCSAVGNPRPNITWFGSSESFRSERYNITYKKETNPDVTTSVLSIDKASFADDGLYYCSYFNQLNRRNSTTVNVTVFGKFECLES